MLSIRTERRPFPARRGRQNLLCLLSVLAVVYVLPGFVQAQTPRPDCPVVVITSASKFLRAEGNAKFTAVVAGGSGKSLEYQWALSRGTIVSRSDKQEVEVKPGLENAGTSMDVFVKVTEVGSTCETYSSFVAEIFRDPIGEPVDRFGVATSGLVKMVIDNYFISLMDNPGHHGYIYFEYDKKENSYQRQSRINSILSAIRFRRYDVSKISFALYHCPTGTATTLWLAMPGAKMPDENGPYEIVDGASILRKPQLGVPKPNCTCPKQKTN